jgi:hypothetical protein
VNPTSYDRFAKKTKEEREKTNEEVSHITNHRLTTIDEEHFRGAYQQLAIENSTLRLLE